MFLVDLVCSVCFVLRAGVLQSNNAPMAKACRPVISFQDMSEELGRVPNPFQTIVKNPKSHKEPLVRTEEEDFDSDDAEEDDEIVVDTASDDLKQKGAFELDDDVDLDTAFLRNLLSPTPVNEPIESSSCQTARRSSKLTKEDVDKDEVDWEDW
jgi:hypothetical protein